MKKINRETADTLMDAIDVIRRDTINKKINLFERWKKVMEAKIAETDSKKKAELQREQSKLREKIATLEGEAEGLREALVLILDFVD